MKIERIANVEPSKKDIVTVKVAGNVTEIRFVKARAGSPIKKVNKDFGVDVRTGEAVEYKHNDSRAGDKASVAQSLKRLRDIINANLTEPDNDNALWLTLTYASLMADTRQLYTDFHAFWKRFKRYLTRKGHPSAEFIACAEPQGRGAWHLHLILLFPGKAPFLPNDDISKIWKHGFTKTKRLSGSTANTNIGQYLVGYLADMEITEAIQARAMRGNINIKEVETTDEDGTRRKKAIIKGARLQMYPKGFRIWRGSRNLKRPTICQMTEGEAQKLVGDTPLTYEKTISLTNSAGDVKNIINYRTYTKTPAESDSKPSEQKENRSEETDTSKNTK